MWICINNWLLSLINNGMFSGENLGLVLAMGFVFIVDPNDRRYV